MKTKYPERPLIVGLAVLCTITLIASMAITHDPVVLWMLLGIEICIIVGTIWYVLVTR